MKIFIGRQSTQAVIPGALVATVEIGPLGVTRAEVRRTFVEDGHTFAEVVGRVYSADSLVVIRGPIAPRPRWVSSHFPGWAAR